LSVRLIASAAVATVVLSSAALAATPAPAPAAAAPAAAAKPAAKPGPSDKAQIQALENRFAAAVTTKDVAKIMAFYARQGLFVFDVAPPRQHVGWDDYRKDWEAYMAAIPGAMTFKLTDLDVVVVGSVAYGHSVQDMSWTTKDGAATQLVVRVSDVWRKAGGRWLIVQEHVSVPVDIDSGKADLLSKP